MQHAISAVLCHTAYAISHQFPNIQTKALIWMTKHSLFTVFCWLSIGSIPIVQMTYQLLNCMHAGPKMKKLLISALLLALAAQGVSAQTDTETKPAKPDPRSTVPRYATPYVKRQAQLEAMTPRADNLKNAYGADTALSPNANGSYVTPPVRPSSYTNSAKRKIPRVEQPSRKTEVKESDSLYGNDQWSSEQTYADPNTASPYGSVR
jgi:hypothetical protein